MCGLIIVPLLNLQRVKVYVPHLLTWTSDFAHR